MENKSAQSTVSWVALVVSIAALVISLIALMQREGERPSPAAFQTRPFSSMPGGGPMSGTPPDLSTMTPRQAADRLFNRVMAATEKGDTATAMQFVPMALQAYKNLETLDNDARYHVALLDLVAGDLKDASAQVDLLFKSAPNHLLGIMVEYDLAQQRGNKKGAAGAYKKFLSVYDTEITKANIEYQEHRSGIERFRDKSLNAVTKK